MRKSIFGLSLPERMLHAKKVPWYRAEWVILALHYSWSITWSWALYWRPPTKKTWWRFLFSARRGCYGHVALTLPLIGGFDFSWQPTMPRGERFWLWRISKLHFLSVYADQRLGGVKHKRLSSRFAWV